VALSHGLAVGIVFILAARRQECLQFGVRAQFAEAFGFWPTPGGNCHIPARAAPGGFLANLSSGGLLEHLEPYLAHKPLIDQDALSPQNVGDCLRRRVQAEAVEGVPDRSFRAGCAHGGILPAGCPPGRCCPCFFIGPGLR
jgi:hypothetical protein